VPTAQIATVNLTLTITPPSTLLTISTTSLPDGTAGAPYSATVTANGGMMPYVWSVVSGRLPAGLTLNAQTGAITGTPFSSFSTVVRIAVSDATTPSPQSAAVSLALTIN
jgi:hypothetical protein